MKNKLPNWQRLTEEEKDIVVGRLTFQATSMIQGFEDVSFIAAYQHWCVNGWSSKRDDIMKFSPKDDLVMVTGLGGETGEVLEEIKKYHRDDLDFEEFKKRLTLELGDQFYYMNVIATRYGIPFDRVIAENVKKLEERRAKKARKAALARRKR